MRVSGQISRRNSTHYLALGNSHRRIRTADRSAIPQPEDGLDREEALPTPSALPASDDSLFGVGSLDHPELERATASTPDSSLGAGGVRCHRAPVTATAVGELENGLISPPRRSFPRVFRETSRRPGVRVVSVFSRTLGRIGGRGGPLRRGLNLWVLALQGSPVQARMVDTVGKNSNRVRGQPGVPSD